MQIMNDVHKKEKELQKEEHSKEVQMLNVKLHKSEQNYQKSEKFRQESEIELR